MSVEEFRSYWLNVHGPLATGLSAKQSVKKYVQCHTIQPEANAQLKDSRGLAEPYDGIAELWWEDIDAFRADVTTPDLEQAFMELIEDEKKFIDLSQSCAFFTEDFPQYEEET